MDKTDTQVLKAFSKYREIKKRLQADQAGTSLDLEEARQNFCSLVPKDDKDPDKVLEDWEKAFHEADCMNLHQGG